uniref:Uncharacterized protein n=1 Tax=Burkholderia sp. (strain CCGE1003) TaxID=640512 RepID=E1T8F6_BURSG
MQCAVANEIGFGFALTFAQRQFNDMWNRQLIQCNTVKAEYP